VILREAGGALLDTRGRALRYSGASTQVAEPFIATTSRLMPPLLAFLATQPDMRGGELR
jgi:3'-phosphoadenosine 5'-phosphosulfate (PAPS) 3'-phosphatase